MAFVRFVLICSAIVILACGIACANPSLEFVGQWGGTCKAEAIAGDIAYVGMGPNFEVLDVSDATQPVRLGKLRFQNYITAIGVSGNIACVSTASCVLYIVDVSSAESPAILGEYSGLYQCCDIEISGNFVYVARVSYGFSILNLTDPTRPELICTYDTAGYTYDIQISGNYAYVADGSNGLLIFDISDPTSPSLMGSYATPNCIRSVAISGQYAYATDSYYGLLTIDISDPTSPTKKANASLSSSGSGCNLSVSGEYVYVAAGSAGMDVFSISNPAKPARKANLDANSSCTQILVSGNYAYLVDEYLQIVSIETPTSPEMVGSYNTGGSLLAAAVSDTNAYLTSYEYGFEVIDISDRSDAQLIGQCQLKGTCRDLLISRDYAYLTNSTFGICRTDISDPTMPSSTWYTNGIDANCLALSDNYVFVGGDDYVYAVDMYNGYKTTAGKFSIADYALGIVKRENKLFVAANSSGLQIIDVATPTNMSLLGSCDTGGNAADLTLSGDYAYIADSTGLVTINVSDPTSPVYNDTISEYGALKCVICCGNYLFAKGNGCGLLVIDISDPSTPSVVYTDSSTFDRDIVTRDNYLYAVDYNNGLSMFKINGVGSASISGRVTDSSGNPIAEVIVSTDECQYSTSSDTNGYYTLSDVIPGTYALTASKSGWMSSDGSTTLSDGGSDTCNFTLQSGGTISGYVKDSVGNPVSSVTITAYPGITTTDSAGWYELTILPAGTYSATASKSLWTSVTNNNVEVADSSTTTLNFTLQVGAITGKVTDSSGNAISSVVISSSTGDYSATTATDGTYTISNVIPGSYEFTTSKYGWLDTTTSVSVTGGTTTTANIALSTAGIVTGYVLDSDGNAISGATVSGSYSCHSYSVSSGSDGSYVIPNAYPKTSVTLTGYKYGYASVKKSITVTAGVTTTCNFRLGDAVTMECLGTCTLSTGPYDVAVSGNYAYVASGSTGLQIVNVSDSANPYLAGVLDTDDCAYGAAVANGYAYVADGSDGLLIIDVSDPVSPFLVSEYDTAGSARDVAIEGSLAYVADGSSGLQIIDVSDPANPLLVGSYDTTGISVGIKISGSYAYIADAGSGVQIIDVSTTSSPTLTGTYDTAGTAQNLDLYEQYTYVADYSGGFLVLNTSSLSDPVYAGSNSTSGYACDVAVSGNYAYVAAGNLDVMDISDPTSPGMVESYNGYFLLRLTIANGLIYAVSNYGAFEILTLGGPEVKSITPNLGSNTGSISITDLYGLAFKTGAAVRLTRTGENDIAASDVNVVAPTDITCSFDLTGAKPGYWDVIVTNPDGKSGTLASGFAVTLPDSTRKIGISGSCCKHTIMADACKNFRFVLWGEVTKINSKNFWLDDGSGCKIKVITNDGYSDIITGDYASACGTLDISGDSVVLISSSSNIREQGN